MLYKLTLKGAYEKKKVARVGREKVWQLCLFYIEIEHCFESTQTRVMNEPPQKEHKQHETGQTMNKEAKNWEKIQRKQASH